MTSALTTFKRTLRHLTMTRWRMRAHFSEAAMQAITAAVRDSEQRHGGEIRVAIEADWPLAELWQKTTPRQRAVQVFAQLHVWDTAHRNGVLIYLCLADRDVEIVADRGLDSVVSAQEWEQVCRRIEQACAQGQYQAALCEAVRDTGELIARRYPAKDRNEQPDRPVLL